MAYKDGLRAYATIVRNSVRDVLHISTSWAYGRVWDWSFWLDARHFDGVNWFRGWSTGIGWFDDVVTAPIRDAFITAIDFAYNQVRGVRDYPIVFFNERWSDERGTWWWIYVTYDVLWWLESLAEVVGDWIDHAPERVYAPIFDALNWLLDYPGYALGAIAQRLSGAPSNYWPYAKSVSANNYEALGKTVDYFGAALGLRFNDLRSWAERLPLLAVDFVGWASGEFQRRLAGSEYNQWDVVKRDNPDIVTALGAIWGNIGDTLVNRFDDAINSAQYHAQQLVNALLGEFGRWASQVQPYLDWIDDSKADIDSFFRDPTGKIWAAIEDEFKVRIEPILIRLWDGR